MAFQVVIDLSADKTIALGGTNSKTNKPNPTSVEGYFLGTREVKTDDNMSKLHFFQTPDGNVAVWGKADMTKKIAGVNPGTMTRITFVNIVKVAKGKMYVYEVAQDRENTIELDNLAGSGNSTGAGEPSFGNEDEDTEEETASYSSAQADQEEEHQNQALAAAERKAKVQALLDGKGKRA